MAFKALSTIAQFSGPTADRTDQLEECAIGDEWFDDTLGVWFKKSNAGAWVEKFQSVDSGAAQDRTPAHTAVTATSVTGALLAANAARKAALFINIGSVDVYIGLGVAAVASQGILLQANGGSYAESDKLGNLDVAAVNCITASGTAVVVVTEWT
jgi:hypothetical protein